MNTNDYKIELLNKIAQRQIEAGFHRIDKIHRKSRFLFTLELLVSLSLVCTFNYSNQIEVCSQRPALGVLLGTVGCLGVSCIIASLIFTLLCCDKAYKISILDVQKMYNALEQFDFELGDDYYNFFFISNYSQALYSLVETAEKKNLRYRIELVFSIVGCSLLTLCYIVGMIV